MERTAEQGRCGELAFPLSSGYVRCPSGEVTLDPDEQVQTVIRLIFAQFERLGTLHGVLRYLVDHDIQLGIRLREEADKGTLEWRRPNRMTLQTLLHNPAYAGTYAYGRRRVAPRCQDPARPSTGRVGLRLVEGALVGQGHAPAQSLADATQCRW
ncbi:recombinase family protein [Streptomyces mirabilis]|uniref:recombinase family protein n=1 Tax=Streptomyces mirabilis TaxID=68239 RepID=UPI0036886B3D